MKKRILLIGDSIRMAYLPLVKEALTKEAEIYMIKENCQDSQKVRKKLKKWIKKGGRKHPFDIIHFNCGLHDIKRKFGETTHQVPIDKYKENLAVIVEYLQKQTKAILIWATTTPVLYERHHEVKGFDRFEEDVVEYNAVAEKIIKGAGIEIDDLYQIIMSNSPPECILPDGVHMNEKGNRALADSVVMTLLGCLDQT